MMKSILLLIDNLKDQRERAYEAVDHYASFEDPDGEIIYNEGKSQGKADALSSVLQKLMLIVSEGSTEGGDKDASEATGPMA